MAKVDRRKWKIPSQRTRRKAWGFTLQVHGKQVLHLPHGVEDVFGPEDVDPVIAVRVGDRRVDVARDRARRRVLDGALDRQVGGGEVLGVGLVDEQKPAALSGAKPIGVNQ